MSCYYTTQGYYICRLQNNIIEEFAAPKQNDCDQSIINNNYYYKEIIDILTFRRGKLIKNFIEKMCESNITQNNYNKIHTIYNKTIFNLNNDYHNLKLYTKNLSDTYISINRSTIKKAETTCSEIIKNTNNYYKEIINNLTIKRNEIKNKVCTVDNYSDIDKIYEKTIKDLTDDSYNLEYETNTL